MDIHELLDLTIKNNASDLHLLPGVPPALRIDGQLRYLSNYTPATASEMEAMIFSILKPEQKELLINNKEIDFSFGFGGGAYGDLGRFRTNLYYQRGVLSAAFRYLQPKIRTIEELELPSICHSFANLKQGFILVTGPTGHGKSTTIAAIINEINLGKAAHILTIEDPIEYLYPAGKSI
ncbi:MAG: ATPase, T2SS/T4P/T4SS family, partial [bacterium]|nr:ATPase, T2SS/T4P/T4SS family [bacterium]